MKHGVEAKVGLFVAALIAVIVFSTIKIEEGPLFFEGGYDISVVVDSAAGINDKTTVEIAGIQVGHVSRVALNADGRRADVVVHIDNKAVQLPQGSRIVVRSRGFLGDSYLEMIPGDADQPNIEPGGSLEFGGMGGDVNQMVSKFSDVADDIKVVSQSIRDIVDRNQKNINEITDNLAVISTQLRSTIAEGRRDALDSLSSVASITRKVDEGRGTIGRLVNDGQTVDKVNTALDGINETLGGFSRLETEIGYHTEFLGASKDFKHYVHFDLWPRPDQAFLFEFVEDRSPSANRVTRTTTVTAGGASSTVTSDTNTVSRNKFRISAQLAKKLYDFTLRGGIIESRGGVGVDYTKGPMKLSASAFDFNTQQGNKPHLKFTGKVNVLPAVYLMGGADDPLNPAQKTDWFVGAGLQLRDDDIKALLGAGGLGAAFGN